jgi:acyl-[acyl-carrier-protein]-phospholipid O-acyltransferase/long-chain-fatty-acid--[acyl-carrier-protein] ligase
VTALRSTGRLVEDFIAVGRRRRSRVKVADSTGAELTGGALLARTLVLRRFLRRTILDADEETVGLLMPPSVGAAVVNVALTLDRRIAVNLNYTLSNEVLNACIRTAGIRRVLTTRKVLRKLELESEAELVFVEELRDEVGLWDKVVGAFQAFAVPQGMLARLLGAKETKPDDVLTLIFTSGSTGTPKGVMLTHQNISSNVAAIADVVDATPKDVFLGVLPFFHSFGYTATLWTTMTMDVGGVYHFNPLDARPVGQLCERYGVTVIQATPTFLRTYLRRCTPEQLRKVDVVVTGAEKLPRSLADDFEVKFGTRPVEAYGATELSPLIACNIPPSRTKEDGRDCKEGTVGRPALRVRARAVDLETGEPLPAGETGMLRISGPNVMKGYFGRPDLTDEVVRDGWYITGDLGSIDADGFLRIEGRLSRFSKIGGEMVPHVGVEDALNRILGAAEDGSMRAAVTAVPDPKKGERLVVLHTAMEEDPEAIRALMVQDGLPNLWIPSPDSWLEVPAIPVLGTGKLALREIRRVAEEHVGVGSRR